ncbi:MAG: amino acid permease [Alphaproteobacteria bacterium]|nr:amino acid permease [Alphaproteobacteria bacterium]
MAQGRLFARKPVADVQREFQTGELKRTLGPLNLVSLGVGCIIGAGIFVITGTAAANFAGPAVIFSFIISGLACVFAALCYAELASTMPVPGSAYTYSYVTMGEVFAWTMGWLLLLEYGVAASTVAAGWTGYVVSLLRDFGLIIPEALSQSTMQFQDGVLQVTPSFNLVGVIGILAVTGLLIVGVSESATVNNAIVFVKVSVLLAFIAIGVTYVDPANWRPFVPENEGGFNYGWVGVFRAASLVFFAYVGFEAVSTAAGEAKNPQRDLPIGILGSLVIVTLLYMAVSAVMTGVVPFRELAVPEPIAVAVDRMNPEWAMIPWALNGQGELNLFSLIIKIGAFTGLSSVMLVLMFGQTRVFYQMARDGLIWRVFSVVNPRFRTPATGTALLGCIIAIAAAVLPLGVLGDLVSLGTAMAFAIVCISVMYLRKHEPTLARPFRVPLYPLIPILGIIMCVIFMMGPIIIDIVSKGIGVDILGAIVGSPDPNFRTDPVALGILVVYIIIGVLVYAFYGYRNSRLGRGEPPPAAPPAEPPGDPLKPPA